MSTNTFEQAKTAGTKAAGQLKDKAGEGHRKLVDTVNEHREKAAGALDTAADAVDRAEDQLTEPLKEYATGVKDRLSDAADYVRDHDAGEMAEDAVGTVKEYPLASLLVITAAVIGAGILVAGMLSQGESDERSDRTAQSNSLFAAASNGLGPKASDTVTRIRDAAVNMALTKAIDSIEGIFPGFREHFDKA